jgi:hypothetical protein
MSETSTKPKLMIELCTFAIGIVALLVSCRSCAISGDAVVQAREANRIAAESKEESVAANEISRQANDLVRNQNDIVSEVEQRRRSAEASLTLVVEFQGNRGKDAKITSADPAKKVSELEIPILPYGLGQPIIYIPGGWTAEEPIYDFSVVLDALDYAYRRYSADFPGYPKGIFPPEGWYPIGVEATFSFQGESHKAFAVYEVYYSDRTYNEAVRTRKHDTYGNEFVLRSARPVAVVESNGELIGELADRWIAWGKKEFSDFEMKEAQQGGGGQPATRSESK